jgi:hypothetical protein
MRELLLVPKRRNRKPGMFISFLVLFFSLYLSRSNYFSCKWNFNLFTTTYILILILTLKMRISWKLNIYFLHGMSKKTSISSKMTCWINAWNIINYGLLLNARQYLKGGQEYCSLSLLKIEESTKKGRINSYYQIKMKAFY